MEPIRTTRYKFLIEYDGTDFVGWQLQSRGRSVQGEIETALQRLCGIPVRVHGSGRTDTGVHAEGQVAHADIVTGLSTATLKKALNALLPHDVSVHEVEEAAADFHARHSASSRSYVYTIAHHRISIDRRRQWVLFAGIDHQAVAEAVACLRGTHDFTTFSKYVPGKTHHYCHVFDARWESDGRVSRFSITANRFLQGMVRCIVGELVRIGRGKADPGEVARMLDARDRSFAPMLAPAHGLVLTEIHYDRAERAIVDEVMRKLRAERDAEGE